MSLGNKFRVILWLTIILAVIICLRCNVPIVSFSSENENAYVTVVWPETEIRDNPHGRRISWVIKGTEVKLTGYTAVHKNWPSPYWTQVQLKNGTIGWIVSEAVR